MATKMHRMACYNSGDLVREEVEIPEVPDNGYLVKVACVGICHSDVKIQALTETLFKPLVPLVMGHEISAYVHKIGSKVKDNDLSVGDRVLVYAWGGCMNCPCCDTYFCPTAQTPMSNEFGVFKPGGYQEYMSVGDRRLLHKLPDTMSMHSACLLGCSGLTTYNAVSTIKPALQTAIDNRGRATLLVIGAGGLGLWAVHWAKELLPDNVKVVVADVSSDKMEQAKKEGADDFVCWDRDASEADLVARTKQVCEGGVDGSIDFVNVPTTVKRFMAAANFGATGLLVGLMGGDLPQFPLDRFALRCLTLKGLYVGTIPQQKEVIRLVDEKKMQSPPITLYKQGDINTVLAKLKKGEIQGRAVIQYDCGEYEKKSKV